MVRKYEGPSVNPSQAEPLEDTTRISAMDPDKTTSVSEAEMRRLARKDELNQGKTQVIDGKEVARQRFGEDTDTSMGPESGPDAATRSTDAYHELLTAFRSSDVDDESSGRFDDMIDAWLDLEPADATSADKLAAAKLIDAEIQRGEIHTDRYLERATEEPSVKPAREARVFNADELRDTTFYRAAVKEYEQTARDGKTPDKLIASMYEFAEQASDDPNQDLVNAVAEQFLQDINDGDLRQGTIDMIRDEVRREAGEVSQAEKERAVDSAAIEARHTKLYRDARKELSHILDSTEPGAARDAIFKHVDQLREAARQQGDAKTVEVYNQFLFDVDSEKIDVAAMSRRKSELYKTLARDVVNQLALNPDSAGELEQQLDTQWEARKGEGNETARVMYAQLLQDVRSGKLGRIAKKRLNKAEDALGMDLQDIASFARTHLENSPDGQPAAFHAAANIDVRNINMLKAQADALEGMGWFGRTFGKKGKEAKEAKAELEGIAAQLKIVENIQKTLDQTPVEIPAANEEMAVETEPAPSSETSVAELRADWPEEITEILTGLVTETASPKEAMAALQENPEFDHWADALEGLELNGVVDRNGDPIDGTVKIREIKWGKGKSSGLRVYMNVPGKGNVSRRLDEFMHKNLFSAEELVAMPEEEEQPVETQDLREGWPDEISDILQTLATHEVSPDVAMGNLVNSDAFNGWADSLQGRVLDGVISLNEEWVEGPVTIRGIERGKNATDTKIKITLPNGRNATRRLDEFMDRNFLTSEAVDLPDAPKPFSELAESFPDEINDLLETYLAAPPDQKQHALRELDSSDEFMDWKSGLIGKELSGVRKGDGSVIDDTLKIVSVRKNSGNRPTIYMKRPDGRRVTISLERFLKENLGENPESGVEEDFEVKEFTLETAQEWAEGIPDGQENLELLQDPGLTYERALKIVHDFNVKSDGVHGNPTGFYKNKKLNLPSGGSISLRRYQDGTVYISVRARDFEGVADEPAVA